MAKGTHYTSLIDGHAIFKSELGSVTRIIAKELRILNQLSIKRLVLAAGSIRAPHWHANCAELGYCVSGQALVSILGNASSFSAFQVDLIRSTGTSGSPRSVLPQQQPLQRRTWAGGLTLVVSGPEAWSWVLKTRSLAGPSRPT